METLPARCNMACHKVPQCLTKLMSFFVLLKCKNAIHLRHCRSITLISLATTIVHKLPFTSSSSSSSSSWFYCGFTGIMQLLLPASVANKRTLNGHTRLILTENPLDRSFLGWMGEILDLDLSHPPALQRQYRRPKLFLEEFCFKVSTF